MARKKAEKTQSLLLRLSEKRKFELSLMAQVLPGSTSMAGIVDWAIDIAVANTPELAGITKVWSPFESDRFVRMAHLYPDTLDPDQQLLWQFIWDRVVFRFLPLYGREPIEDVQQDPDFFVRNFNYKLLRETWDMVKAHVLDGEPWDEQAFSEICRADAAAYETKEYKYAKRLEPHVPKETKGD